MVVGNVKSLYEEKSLCVRVVGKVINCFGGNSGCDKIMVCIYGYSLVFHSPFIYMNL